MTSLYDTLRRHVDRSTVPGAVALVARGDDVEVVTVGSVDTEGTAPMARDAIFRIADLPSRFSVPQQMQKMHPAPRSRPVTQAKTSPA